jgi:GTP-binding protein
VTITKSAFITSLPAYEPLTNPPLPEYAASGRSNVGKSSLLNCISGRRDLAKVSQSPGKTRFINVYRFNDAAHWIDLPGYGYAQASKAEIEKFSRRAEDYFAKTQSLKRVFQLVDIRHAPSADDRTMVSFLKSTGIPFTVVCTKADKLSRAQAARQINDIAMALQVQPFDMIAFSAETGLGADKVRGLIV